LRIRPDFLAAAVALGDAHLRAGDQGQALRAWERGLEAHPALPLLSRIERVYRSEDRPRRMIALYEQAAARVPDDLSVAVALGRVYFELSMLDEAAEQFEKIEVRAPDLPAVHAYLGAIFERRNQTRESLDEYRRALELTASFDWPHRCLACGARHREWADRCPSCRRWNTLKP
jgi:lipopolysaccharide biosynthesis regulator YciM